MLFSATFLQELSCWKQRQVLRVRPEQKEEEKEQKKEKEDGPLEDWRRKELVAECKALGLSDYGVRADLVARIKEARAAAQSDNERPRRPRGPRRQEQDKVE